jgi:hypothetical protein
MRFHDGPPRTTESGGSLLIASGVLALIVLALIGCQLYIASDRVTEAEMLSELRRALPRGSTKEEIYSYLDDRGATYSGNVRPASEVWDLRKKDVDPDALVISALLRDTAGASILTWAGHMNIYFVLRSDGTLDTVYVDEVFDSL